MKKYLSDDRLFILIRDFLTEYLPKQRFCSINTIDSYRATLNLLLDYVCVSMQIGLHQVTFECIDADVLAHFLDWLEEERGCSPSTQNQRLACIRSFYKYAGTKDIMLIAYHQELMKVPLKKTPKTMTVKFLTEDSLALLLQQPDPHRPKEFRNLFYMVLMYDTGCRNQELLDMKLADFHADAKSPFVVVTGKGNKTRVIPVMKKTVLYFEKYKALFHENSPYDSYLFYTISNHTHKQMSPDNVARFMKQYGERAFGTSASEKIKVHPHMLRHTRAMHLYRGGMPLSLISEWLGHAHLETTMIYAYADTEMKREAIQKATAPLNPLKTPLSHNAPMGPDLIRSLYGLK